MGRGSPGVPLRAPGRLTGRAVFFLITAGFLLGAAPTGVDAQAIPFHTPTALPLALEESAPRLVFRHLRSGTLVGPDGPPAGESAPRATTDMGVLVVPYALRRRTVVMVGIPYLRRSLEADETEGLRRTNRGIGDPTVLVKQELLARDVIGGNRRLALFLSASLPAGETESGGEALDPALRLGRGVATLEGQVAYSHVEGRIGLHAAAGYGRPTGSVFGVRPGEEATYDVALGFRIRPARFETLREPTLGGYMEVNGAYRRPATTDGQTVPDTGGHLVFLSPGLQFIPRPNLGLEISVQLPMVREPRGTQLMPDWTLGLSVRTILGFPGRQRR
jgi:hypothetical protein